jgi:hypothetical protein
MELQYKKAYKRWYIQIMEVGILPDTFPRGTLENTKK